MRLNQETVLETTRLFMVPYLPIYVPKYHNWMKDSWLRESTSSELLSLDEEFNAQQQWCNSNDRLTFILLNKQLYHDYWLLKNAKNQLIDLLQFNNEKYSDNENAEIFSMIGDVNLFITYSHSINDIEGELSVMIAESSYRGQGLAAEALASILEYSGRYLPMKLTSLVAKVSMNNEKSIRFFRNRLKFIERSRNTVFNEIEFVPDIQQLPIEEHSSKYSNLPLKASQLIIDRLLTPSSKCPFSNWFYKEIDLKLWRQTVTKGDD
ncbi:N-acetyltransferase 9 [Schistosoma japonicum]|nr:N-acetyltransferase 9 [Schistosoma japonicum]